MKRRRVLVDGPAKQDLRELHRYIALQGASAAAKAYLHRIRQFIASLDIATERGTLLDGIEPGFRVVPFESVVIALRVEEKQATVVRVFHGSQDWLKEIKREVLAQHRKER